MRDIFSIVKKKNNWDVIEGKRWQFVEKGVNLRRRRPIGGLATGMECITFSEETMAKGNSWMTRNRTNADFGREGRFRV